jgi:hypothetical protein
VVEYGGDTLSRYDVSFAPGETKLVSVTNPRLFPTKHRPPQLKLFALDEALGEGGWLKAFGLEPYAPRSRGGPSAAGSAVLLPRSPLGSHRKIWGESSVKDQDARPPAAGTLAP